MKLLCVERDLHLLLKVGEVYTAVGGLACICGRSWYFIEEFPDKRRYAAWRCRNCQMMHPDTAICAKVFLQRRFIPWNPDELKVSEQEANQLYSPIPLQDEFDRQLEKRHRHALTYGMAAKRWEDFFKTYPECRVMWRRMSNPYDTGS